MEEERGRIRRVVTGRGGGGRAGDWGEVGAAGAEGCAAICAGDGGLDEVVDFPKHTFHSVTCKGN